jgi:hypothetical protein
MATDEEKTVEDRVIAFAEQVGRLVGTVEKRTDGWLDRKALNEQVSRIRDGATDLLSHLGGASGAATAPKKKPAAAAPRGRSGGTVDAPGKTHRKPAQSTRGAKRSDQRISNTKRTKTMRRPQRRG